MSARVLVVDDDEGIRDLAQDALTGEGHQVRTARNGADALTVLDRGFAPDVILLDLRMPIMNGAQFARSYLGRPGPHAPIVVFTAGPGDAATDAREVPADAALAKPFDLEDLITLVARYPRA